MSSAPRGETSGGWIKVCTVRLPRTRRTPEQGGWYTRPSGVVDPPGPFMFPVSWLSATALVPRDRHPGGGRASGAPGSPPSPSWGVGGVRCSAARRVIRHTASAIQWICADRLQVGANCLTPPEAGVPSRRLRSEPRQGVRRLRGVSGGGDGWCGTTRDRESGALPCRLGGRVRPRWRGRNPQRDATRHPARRSVGDNGGEQPRPRQGAGCP